MPLDEAPAPERLLALLAAMLRELRPLAAAPVVHLDDTFDHDLGLDSLSRMELTLRIERELGVRLPEAAAAARTPRELWAAILSAAHAATEVPASETPPSATPAVAGTPDAASTLVEALSWHVERHPDREHITLIDGERTLETLTYGRLWSDGHDIARGLAQSGVRPGDTVALMLPTGAAFFRTFVGALLAGAVPVPLYPPARWSDIEAHVRGRAAILGNAGARVLVTVPEARFVGRLAGIGVSQGARVITAEALCRTSGPRIQCARSGGDIALLQYTSGSTGDPKGVVLTHDNLLANIRAMGAAAAVTSADRFMSWLPLYHDMGLIGAWLGSLYYAMPLVLMPPTAFLARPSRWLRAIHRYRATISAGPNFAYDVSASKIADEDIAGIDLSSWRLAFNGAEPVRAATLERFAARFAPYGFDRRALTPVYGLAESAVGLAFPPLERGPRIDCVDARALTRDGIAALAGVGSASAQNIVSCGRPLPGHAIRVIDELRHELPPRHEGRIEFRGPSATAGYYRNEDATRRLRRDDWLDTGDVGYIADGELFVTSRIKDLIKRGGHNLHPYGLEAAVGEIPGIRKGCVAVFGTQDHASGTERVVVVAETRATGAADRRALRERIVALAAIELDGPADEVLLVPPRTILKTSSGKIRRSACRELYDKGLLEAPRRAVWVQVARLLARSSYGRVRRIEATARRAAYGLYSLVVFTLVALTAVALIALLPSVETRLRAARACARLLLRLCGLDVRVQGSEQLASTPGVVIVANHASYVDAILLTAVLPAGVRFAAKREFARTRVLGFVLRRVGACFVDRDDASRGIRDVAEVTAAVRAARSVVFFPEGTFTREPGLAAFRLGAFVVAAATGAPLVPVVLRGARSVLRDGQWLPTRHPIEVVIGPVVRAQGTDWSASVRLRAEVRAGMLERSGEPDLTGP